MIEDSLSHAKKEYPRESCGLLVVFKGRERYIPCRNISDTPHKNFIIHPEDYIVAEKMGEITKIVHSHPNKSPKPSQADLVNLEHLGLPWIIINPQTGEYTETNPTGYKAPLVGREYSYGTLDCFTIIRDYYAQELSIRLPDRDREGRWWESGKSLLIDHFKEWGFKKVNDLQKHDVILMYGGANTPSHLGVYLGDGDMLHHCEGRLSSRDVYGNAGYWYKSTWGYLRHIDLLVS